MLLFIVDTFSQKLEIKLLRTLNAQSIPMTTLTATRAAAFAVGGRETALFALRARDIEHVVELLGVDEGHYFG